MQCLPVFTGNSALAGLRMAGCGVRAPSTLTVSSNPQGEDNWKNTSPGFLATYISTYQKEKAHVQVFRSVLIWALAAPLRNLSASTSLTDRMEGERPRMTCRVIAIYPLQWSQCPQSETCPPVGHMFSSEPLQKSCWCGGGKYSLTHWP